jgi:hypothetical protein
MMVAMSLPRLTGFAAGSSGSPLASSCAEENLNAGVDDTLFSDFFLIFGEKFGVFLKNKVLIQILQKNND